MPVVSSRTVAEYFGKRRDNVLRDIDELIKKAPELRGLIFEDTFEIKRIGTTAREVPVYWMDRKGFCLLAMGITGAKALTFKCSYIRERLQGRKSVPVEDHQQIREESVRTVRELILQVLRPFRAHARGWCVAGRDETRYWAVGASRLGVCVEASCGGRKSVLQTVRAPLSLDDLTIPM